MNFRKTDDLSDEETVIEVYKDNILKINCNDSFELELLKVLSRQRLPDLESLIIKGCGDHLNLLRNFLNIAFPYSVLDLTIDTKKQVSFDDDSSEPVIDVKRFFQPKPEFIEDLCEVISTAVRERVFITGFELTTPQFCSLVTAADECERIEVFENKVDQKGEIRMPYSEMRNAYSVNFSSNCLSNFQVKKVSNHNRML